jgi:hypothetical protein
MMNARPLLVLGLATAAAIAAVSAVPAAPAAAQAPETAGFVVRLGVDTVAVEQFTRTGNRIEGWQLVRSPRTMVREFALELDAAGAPFRFDFSSALPGGAATLTVDLLFGTDTAVMRVVRGDSVTVLRIPAARGAFPVVGNLFMPYDLLTRGAVAGGADSLVAVLVAVASPRPLEAVVLPRSGDAGDAFVRTYVGTNRVRLDGAGRLLAWDGQGTALQVTAERVATLDRAALTAAFAARDAQGQALGTLSPRDTTRATVAGANLVVDYSRPLRRGRTIFGGVVPFGEVWRTGANAATHLTTDRELELGGARVPPGTYTLYTIPERHGWLLIVSRATGQWGTDYAADQDLARVPMKVERLRQPTEQFTIGVDEEAGAGVLWMAWDDTRAAIPFRVR